MFNVQNYFMKDYRAVLKQDKNIIVLSPKNPEHNGEDAASITNIEGFYVPMFLMASANGFAQAVQSTLVENVVYFDKINAEFYNSVVCPLAKEMNKGLKVLEEFKKKH